jgi:hypothetical protein
MPGESSTTPWPEPSPEHGHLRRTVHVRPGQDRMRTKNNTRLVAVSDWTPGRLIRFRTRARELRFA